MRRSIVFPCSLLALSLALPLVPSLGCGGSAERDPKAAANAAKSAGGALEPLTLEPGGDELGRPKPGGRLPHPNGPGVKPPPVEKGATCITDDGDADDDEPTDQKGPRTVPKGPLERVDLEAPEVEGAVPKRARAMPSPPPPPSSPDEGTARMAVKTTAPTNITTLYASRCETRMDGQCTEFCRAHGGLTWDSGEGSNGGTCFETRAARDASGRLTTEVDCGCWCK